MRIRPTIIASLLFFCVIAQPPVYATDDLLPIDTTITQSPDDATDSPLYHNDTVAVLNDTNAIDTSNDTTITQIPDYATDNLLPNDTTITQLPNYSTDNTLPIDTIIYIRGIEVYGNATTRPEILKLFFDFDIGDTLDVSKLASTRTRLLRSELYEKVDIFPHMREDGAHIFVVLKEAVRVSFSGGLTYYTYKHGREDLWFVANADAVLYNFRGRLEEVSLGVNLWEYRSLSLYWQKPFLSSPYYVSAATSVSHYPDEALPLNYLDAAVKMTAGRSVSQHSRAYISAIPIYRHRSVVESKLEGTRHYDTIAFPDMSDFYEAFGAVGFATDFRAKRFDPRSGWSLNSEIRTNRVYRGVNAPFFQLRSECRYYLPLFFDDVAALRVALTLRDTDAGAYHRLTAGSTGSLRGYHEQALGWRFVANSSILASVKYHKPVWETPPLPFPVLGAVYGGRNEIVYRVDATLIADYALLRREPLGALSFRGPRESGIGLGFGTRIVIPEIRQSGCIDLVFGRQDGRQTDPDSGKAVWKPMLHVYFDLFY